MVGVIIDHMFAVTVLLVALSLTLGMYNQNVLTAVAYARHRQVALKAVALTEVICLSPGLPDEWGRSHSAPLGFGLQDPRSTGYALSPYAIMRLRTTPEQQLVYYPKTGSYYNNVSLGPGGSLLMPVGDCVNYSTATTLLGITDAYGFRITLAPTVNITISQVPAEHLILRVDVRGPGLPLSDATLYYHLHQVVPGSGNAPAVTTHSGVCQTDGSGSALIEFPAVDDADDAYAFIVNAHLGEVLRGVSYYSHNALEGYPPFVVPLIADVETGTIIVAHSWDIHDYGPPVPDVHYNATFFLQTPDYRLQPIQTVNATGHLNYGEGKPYTTTQVPASSVGILLITYRWGNRLGSVMVPWGISALGFSVTFGGDPSGYAFVATELRQVAVHGIPYQVQVAVWSLR